jgi:H+/Cl- antiporter ClcA
LSANDFSGSGRTANFTPSPVYTQIGVASFFSGTARMTITPAFRIVSATGSYQLGGTLTPPAPWRAALVTFVRA